MSYVGWGSLLGGVGIVLVLGRLPVLRRLVTFRPGSRWSRERGNDLHGVAGVGLSGGNGEVGGLCAEPDPGPMWRGGVAAERYAVFIGWVLRGCSIVLEC